MHLALPIIHPVRQARFMSAMNDPNVHPMVPVQEAIRTVLKETARILVTPNAKPNASKSLSTDTSWSDIVGKVLDQDVLMASPGYPPYRASIMDGYAIRSTEASASDTVDQWTHRVVDKVYAGDETGPISDIGDAAMPAAYYITTGAVVPDACNCVVPIEECQVSEAGDVPKIRIQSSAVLEVNKWIRPVGCDIAVGSVVLPKGHVMDAVALGLLRQAGAGTITVKRPLVVGVLSTGNELISGNNDKDTPSEQAGKIPDVNRPILLNLLNSFGNYCQTVDLGSERDDDVLAMAEAIDNALEVCDVIITTGGISMGESDIVESVLVEHCHGKLHFGRMHMKPGKPTTFVTIPKGDAVRLVFAMPGNPVSATVCTQLLVKPCLDLLFHNIPERVTCHIGENISESVLNEIVNHSLVHPEIHARLSHDIKLDQQRPEYHRVVLQKSTGGGYEVSTTGVQRSSRLMSCRDAQALLVLPVGSLGKPKALQGELYPILLLRDLRGYDQLELKDSKHFVKRAKESKVAIVEVVPKEKSHLSALETTCERVKSALSGSKSGNAAIVSKKIFSESMDELYDCIIDSNEADFIVVSCVSFEGSFPYHLDVATALRDRLQKPAKSIALQARQGAATENPTAALFEVVAGYAPENHGAMVICLPDKGVQGGIGNVRGLLKHALNVARDKPHNHHHSHKHHEHGKTQHN